MPPNTLIKKSPCCAYANAITSNHPELAARGPTVVRRNAQSKLGTLKSLQNMQQILEAISFHASPSNSVGGSVGIAIHCTRIARDSKRHTALKISNGTAKATHELLTQTQNPC